jgi:hypothetical protein
MRMQSAPVCALSMILLAACATSPSPTPTAPSLDAVILRASSSRFERYEPIAVIDAVNALVPLGKEGALEALEVFLAREPASDEHQGLFLVLRVLFDTPSGVHPPMRLGGSSPAAPSDATLLPRFPIALIDDVPIMLVSGYMLGGEPEHVRAHIAFYRAEGVIRATPLAPTKTTSERWAELQMVYNRAYGAPLSRLEGETLYAQLRSAER